MVLVDLVALHPAKHEESFIYFTSHFTAACNQCTHFLAQSQGFLRFSWEKAGSSIDLLRETQHIMVVLCKEMLLHLLPVFAL